MKIFLMILAIITFVVATVLFVLGYKLDAIYLLVMSAILEKEGSDE